MHRELDAVHGGHGRIRQREVEVEQDGSFHQHGAV
jgi:hypothetical protein